MNIRPWRMGLNSIKILGDVPFKAAKFLVDFKIPQKKRLVPG
jgi:hypothetical protein